MRIEMEKKAFAARLATAARVSQGGISAYRAVLLHAAEADISVVATDGNLEFCGRAPSQRLARHDLRGPGPGRRLPRGTGRTARATCTKRTLDP